jgi:hypothetical protein
VNGGQRGEVRRRGEEGGFYGGERSSTGVHSWWEAAIAAWPSGSARRLGNPWRTEGDDRWRSRHHKIRCRRPRSLTCGAGVSVASCRVLPAPPIGSCRTGAGAGVPAIFLGSMARRLVFGGADAALFCPPTRWPHFESGVGATGGDALGLNRCCHYPYSHYKLKHWFHLSSIYVQPHHN